MTVTRHFKKKSRLSFPFLLQPHLQVGIFLMLMMRFFGRLHESLRGEKCCLIRAKLFKKKCMFKIYKLFRSYMVTVQKLLRHCVKLGVASRLPQISPEALTLCCFFFSVSQTCCLDIALLLDNFQSAANDISPKRNVIEDRSTALN